MRPRNVRTYALLFLAPAALLACARQQPAAARADASTAGAVAAPAPTAGFLANTSTTGGVIFFPAAAVGLPTPVQTPVTGIPAACASPQGAAYYEADHALVACFTENMVLVVQASTSSVLATIDTTGKFNGAGTIAVAPSLTSALGVSGTTVAVIHAPFDESSNITTVTLQNSVPAYQGEAVVFDPSGNAYIRTIGDITVLPPPYTAVGFRIPLAGQGGIAISPEGDLLLTTDYAGSKLHILTAPFSATSTPVTLTVPAPGAPDGIAISPDGSVAITASAAGSAAWALHAPFSDSSTFEALPVPAGVGSFEDVAFSADSQLAMLSGNDTGSGPLIAVQAPFTAASATGYSIAVAGGRGGGSFRFVPPGLAAGPTLSASAPATVVTGSALTVTLTYGNSGEGDLTGAEIRAEVPQGTTFVSATAGGVLTDGVVVWQPDTVPAGATGRTVTFVVEVGAAGGQTVSVAPASIQGDASAKVFSQPLSVAVIGVCGNGVVEAGEECDDHNTAASDGCSATCQIEPAYAVTFETDGTPGASLDGDADQHVYSGGSATAVLAVAPAGFAFAGWSGTGDFEATSTNPLVLTGVAAEVTLTAHFVAAVCGNGVVEAGEECDDHNTTSSDGCSSTCRTEAAYAVTFETDGTPGASLDGEASQHVYSGGSATAVLAVPPAGFAFAGWTGSGGFVATDSNPLVMTGVTAEVTVTAHFIAAPKSAHRSRGCGCSSDEGGTSAVAPTLLLGLWAAWNRRRRGTR